MCLSLDKFLISCPGDTRRRNKRVCVSPGQDNTEQYKPFLFYFLSFNIVIPHTK